MQADKPAVAPQGHLYRGVSEPFLQTAETPETPETPGGISRQGLPGPGYISSDIRLSMVGTYIAAKL